MRDPNWQLVSGQVALEIELLNYANQTNVLEALIRFLLAHRGPFGDGNAPMPDEIALCQLHNAGTLFLLDESGSYRNIEVHIQDANGNKIYEAPDWQDVKPLMRHFFREMSSIWTSGDALDIASYALWRINWIHPFRNGNGRTARAFSYACLCLKLGGLLPGRETVVDLIMKNRDGYQAALRAADAGLAGPTHLPNLGPMKAYLDDLLQKQMASIHVGNPYIQRLYCPGPGADRISFRSRRRRSRP